MQDQKFSIQIPMHLHRAMQAHGEATYPHECCGLLIGTGDLQQFNLTRIVPAQNRNQERGHDRFEIDPLFYMQTEKTLAQHEIMIGFYHSHPDCPEIPSQTDRTFALGWPGFIWLIYRIEQKIAASMRAWVLNEDNKQFEEYIVDYQQSDIH